MKSATLIKTDGTQVAVAPGHGDKFTLEELQDFVGGYIELAYKDEDMLIICNEEGKLHGLPINVVATTLWHEKASWSYGDYLVGDVLVCDAKMVD